MTIDPSTAVVICACVSLPDALASLTIVVWENGLDTPEAPENGVTVPEHEPVQPLTVMVLPAVPLVARFHQTVPAPLVFAFRLASLVQVLPPVSSSETEGSAVASRFVTQRTRMSPATTPELMTRVRLVVVAPEVTVLVPTVIAI